MKRSVIVMTRMLGGVLLGTLLASQAGASSAPANGRTETAVLAGGCFWGLEAVFERLRGVTDVQAGFAGGNALTAHYDVVSSGMTGHAESVRITFDPAKISYATLLNVYFRVAHDPTELDRQGPDDGSQYRSEIFYTSPAQAATARTAIAALTASHAFNAPIVTKVEAFHGFYEAESYHQHFYDRNLSYPYIVYNDKPKVEMLRSHYPQLVIDEKDIASRP